MESYERPLGLLVDGHNLLYASFFGMPDRIKTPEGRSVHGVYGFVASLLKMIRQYKPRFVTVCFDSEGATFRHALFEDYKANRPVLVGANNPFSQYQDVLRAIDFLGIARIEEVGVEADDMLGTLATILATQARVYIASRDCDLLQLVAPDVSVLVLSLGQGVVFDAPAVFNKYGVQPRQFVDYRALVGDKSDNIPGVPGIGPKTASSLIREYGNLDAIYASLGALRPRLAELLAGHEAKIRSYQELLSIRTDLPLKMDFNVMRVADENRVAAMSPRYVMEAIGLFPRVPAQYSLEL